MLKRLGTGRRKKNKTASRLPWHIEIRNYPNSRDVTGIYDANGQEVVWDIDCNTNSRERNRKNAELIVESVNKLHDERLAAKKRPAPQAVYGIKAYGKWERFTSEKKYRAYLMDWIAGTEGAERDRAVRALSNLEQGINETDTDLPEEW